MIQQSLNGIWSMTDDSGLSVQGTIPGSVYSFLLDAGKMEDPYYRDNEPDALRLMEQDYTFSRTFETDGELLSCPHIILRFDGIDTLSEIRLNGILLGETDNMHLAWEYDVKDLLREGTNTLEVRILSPTKYIAEKDKEYHLGGSRESMRGFPHLRKAHCMFGWDWGPRLPDGGIWKDVTLLGWEDSRIEDVRIRQVHRLKAGCVNAGSFGTGHDVLTEASGNQQHAKASFTEGICVDLTVDVQQTGSLPVSITLITPDGERRDMENGIPLRIDGPLLWWPNGLGDQPLYEVQVCLLKPGESSLADCSCGPDLEIVEQITRRIGLRTITMRRNPDRWGETFAMEANGQTVFSMGADYIPEDNILSRITRERTRKLLTVCRDSHFNVIRVWGGGFYPADWFYDLCDEMGLVIWQDFMFSCANYRLTDEFISNIREEVRQNVRRIRHHACLGLWCGNNEMEQFALQKEYDGDDVTTADYLVQNEVIIPEILKEEDPYTFYWPSSPSSGGSYDHPADPDRGDVHYWDVWHAGAPFTAYRKYHFRYLSEFGFQSFPCMETVKSFTEEGDRNIFSYVMEMHQRNSGANGKILQYLSQTYLYPASFETLLYASQMLQADAIRCGVEHLRRNRSDDRCMGAVYWQLNDIWPVASWSSVDYYQRWKALQYAAARFFAPVLLSCEEESEVSAGRTCISEPAPVVSRARLNVSNETREAVKDTVLWELRNAAGCVLCSGELPVEAAPFTASWCGELDFSEYDPKEIHMTYRLLKHESCGSVLFTAPKHYHFHDPRLEVCRGPGPDEITVTSHAFAKGVEVWSETGYIRTSDNYFDMEEGSRTIRLLEGKAERLHARSVYDIR